MISLLLLILATAFAADPARHLQDLDAVFLLKNGKTGKLTQYGKQSVTQQFAPCSTFKVPNTVIALETGIAKDADFLIPYNPALKLEGRGPNGSWGKDHTLRSAFQNSVLWYYQEIARRAGLDTMTRFVRQFAYGNADTSAGVDIFWLGNSLKISAAEQVAFLEKLYQEKLGVSPRTMRIAKDIMVADSGPGWKLSAKTGACRGEEKFVSMWYVGFVERGDTVHYFALHMTAGDYEPLMNQRVPKTRAILSELGLISK